MRMDTLYTSILNSLIDIISVPRILLRLFILCFKRFWNLKE